MLISKEINGPCEETGVIYLSTSTNMAVSITETRDGNLKIIHLANSGNLLVKPTSNNSIELVL